MRELAVDGATMDITLDADDPGFALPVGGTTDNTVTVNLTGTNPIPSDGTGYFSVYMLICPGDHTPENSVAKTMIVKVQTDRNNFSLLKQGINIERGNKYIVTVDLDQTLVPWDGVTSTQPGIESITVTPEGGSPETMNAYIITTGEELFWLSENASSLEATLTNVVIKNDIDLGNHPWIPIGEGSVKFTGHIYGLGNTISGLYINGDYENAGLFGTVGMGNIFQNLNVAGTVISTSTGTCNVGGVLGRSSEWNQLMNNVSFSGTVQGNGATAPRRMLAA